MCDHQIMCFGRSSRHTQAIVREVALVAEQHTSFPLLAVEGLDVGEWIAIDFGSLILHVFDISSYATTFKEGMWRHLDTIDYPTSSAEDSISPSFQ